MEVFEPEKINIKCKDGVSISASVYEPKGTIKGAVMAAPATGIKKQFYHHFANFLAANGYAVITYDNRGIGESLEGHIKYSDASLVCWGAYDMSAIFAELKARYPNSKYHLVGHSAGGQLIGIMDDTQSLSSIFNFACSSGSLSNMKLSYYVKASFFMNILIPLSNALFGHTKSQWLGMGEALPKGVARQWRDWCNGRGYIKMAFGDSVKEHSYNELSVPSLWINAIDDDIAVDLNVADMISVFKQTPATTKTLVPHEHGLKEIGHMKFFSRKSESLWKLAIDWFEGH